jgi:hypothetical protein
MRVVRSIVFAVEDPVCARLWAIVAASIAVLANG